MLYYKEQDFEIHEGKMQDVLDTFEPNSIDSIITDPPYELGFFGKAWDSSGVAFQKDTWEHCYRVLKPGGYLLAFGGSRTFHRIACAIEDAGFEIRDTIMWLYGSGFPKSMSIGKVIESKQVLGSGNIRDIKRLNGKKEVAPSGFSSFEVMAEKKIKEYDKTKTEVEYQTELGKKWDGWGTQLKPAYEPIIMARKPVDKTVLDNVIKWGVGGLNIDGCRVPYGNETDNRIGTDAVNTSKCGFWKKEGNSGEVQMYKDNGRFPANVILTYDDTDKEEVCGDMPDTNGGTFKEPTARKRNNGLGLGTDAERMGMSNAPDNYGDSGNASRYFYCAKATSKDRDEGMDEFETQNRYFEDRRSNSFDIFATMNDTKMPCKNIHPTVKPIELMQYLVRMVSPNGAKILDCFMGSGSTGKAVMFENRERKSNYYFIGVEMTSEYLPICKARIEYGKYKYEYDIKSEQAKDMRELGYAQTSIFDI